jgi:hypothetical protein
LDENRGLTELRVVEIVNMEVHEYWGCTADTIIYKILVCQSADAKMTAMGILEVMCDKPLRN